MSLAEPETGEQDGGSRRLLVLLTFGGFLLRIPGLGDAPLWVDEAASWWFARTLLAEGFVDQVLLEPTPPLFYAALGLWMELVGDGPAAMRLPGVVAGTAAIPLVWGLGRRLLGAPAGWIGAGLLAVHPLHVSVSRDARAYPFLLLAVLGTLWSLDRGLRADRRSDWAALVLCLAAAGWTHPYAVFLLALSGAVVLCAGRGKARLRGAVAVAVASALVAPWWIATFPHLRESGAAWSVEELYEILPEEARAGRALEVSLIGAAYNPSLRDLDRPPTPLWVRGPAVAAQLLFLAAAAGLALRRPTSRFAVGLLVSGWIVLVGAPWAVTRAGRAIYHLGRHDAYVLGIVTLLLGAGAVELARRRRRLAVGLLIVVLAAAAHRLVAFYAGEVSDLDRRAGRRIAATARAGDSVVALGIRRLVTEHPARRAGAEVPFRSFPREVDGHPGWSDDRRLVEDLAGLSRDAEALAAELESSADRIHLLTREYPAAGSPPTLAALVDGRFLSTLRRRGWTLDRDASAPDLRIRVLMPPPSLSAAPSPAGRAEEERGSRVGRDPAGPSDGGGRT